uniref:Retroviral polymerase SH3-like domain-containing protein n=1 Tax=Tanacetum cinerariifolium TaxID=118510 RepID=A0A6L2JSM9_TANCI|nr:hypothetical protein [Tanacetum cinerariifolium]
MKFLRSLPFEWNTHVVVWRNKADLDTMSIDDLYNNFKIVEQEVKRTVSTSSCLVTQNMAFLSSPDSTNEVDTANIQVSTICTPVSTVSTYDNTANLSDATVSRKTMNVEYTSSKAMVAIDGAGFDWSYMADDEALTNMALMAFSDLEVFDSDKDESEVMALKYNNVQHKPQQANQPRKVSQNPRNNRTNWNEMRTQKLGVGFQFTKKACFVYGCFSHLIKDCDFHDKKMVQKPVLKNVEIGTGQREVRPVWNNTMRINHQNFSNSKRNFAPTVVLTKSRIVPISTARKSSSRASTPVSAARPINTVAPKPLVNVAKPRQNALQKPHSLSRRLFYQQTALKNKNLNTKINTAKVNFVNTVKGDRVTSAVRKQGINVVQSSACWVWRPKIKGDLQDALKDQKYFNSGCSRHMTGNISYLTDFKEHDGGYVVTGGGAKGGKITSKGTIQTEKGIKKEYSVARTTQQNRVTERRNRTLIEAARTMVLVVKPYFKTLYELFRGRSPTLSFMRPFGCHVTILNTLDQLGKFDEKWDEGIFVRYSTVSKAFRVYNTRTRKVEENLHITFLEKKPMIIGRGPEWFFDIDALSKSMNYAPVPAGINSNNFAGKGASFDAGQSSLETRPSQDIILMPLWKDSSLFDFSSQDSDGHNKDKHGPSQESECDNQERPNAERSTQNVNTTRPSINTANANDNTGSLNINTVCPLVNNVTPTYADYLNDHVMPDLEDTRIFDDTYDDRDEGAEADSNNLETIILVNPIPYTHLHKDHPKEQIIGEIEPKKATQALNDESWVEVMQEELL